MDWFIDYGRRKRERKNGLSCVDGCIMFLVIVIVIVNIDIDIDIVIIDVGMCWCVRLFVSVCIHLCLGDGECWYA